MGEFYFDEKVIFLIKINLKGIHLKKLLQILCQILNTESMQEIQSWLVSADYNGSDFFGFKLSFSFF